jgi:hypothetical protein
MAFTEYTKDTTIIGALGTNPAERGLTTQEFKDKFDQFAHEFVAWFNETHIAEADAHLADTVYQEGGVHELEIEEGTWTPILATHVGNLESVTYNSATFGTYVKIGKVVHIRGWLKTDAVTIGAAVGYATIGGFPFAADANWAALNVAYSKGWATNNPDGLIKIHNNTAAYLIYKPTANGDSAQLGSGDIATGANGNEIHFSGTYYVS